MYSTDQAWSCKISLRFDYDNNGQPIRGDSRCVPFGSTLVQKSDVEILLRRAQVAILNPNISAESFLHKTDEELQYYRQDAAFESGTLKFSRNAIVVDIFDPDSADLSFIDLPGVSAFGNAFMGKCLTILLFARSYSERRR